MSNRTCFLYYKDWAELLLKMPEDLRHRIDDAVKKYVLYGEEPTDTEVLYSMFGIMRQQIDRDDAKWEQTRLERVEYGRLGGLAKASIRQNKLARVGYKVKVEGKDNKESTIVPKKNISLTKPLEERRKDFENTILPYLDQYGQEMCTEFCMYWTEPNKSNTKMRFELQKTWETGRRLSRWNRERRTT